MFDLKNEWCMSLLKSNKEKCCQNFCYRFHVVQERERDRCCCTLICVATEKKKLFSKKFKQWSNVHDHQDHVFVAVKDQHCHHYDQWERINDRHEDRPNSYCLFFIMNLDNVYIEI